MPIVLVYTDPHINLKRKQHYTQASLAAREAWCHEKLEQILGPSEVAICLGDFFDKESNDEAAILRGVKIAEQTTHLMAGNHDHPNREGAASSLQVLKELFPERVILEPRTVRIGKTLFCFAPHQMTQELYDASIKELEGEAGPFGGFRILCLHCSYDSPFELPESALNLTEARARELLSTFHQIWIGHEHKARDIFDGRIRVIGSLFPTSFEELGKGEHRYLWYNTETGDTVSEYVDPAYLKLPASACRALPTHTVHYYELEDDLPHGEAQRLVVDLFNAGAFAVKLRQKALQELPKAEAVSQESILSLPGIIRGALQQENPALVSLWDDYAKGEATC